MHMNCMLCTTASAAAIRRTKVPCEPPAPLTHLWQGCAPSAGGLSRAEQLAHSLRGLAQWGAEAPTLAAQACRQCAAASVVSVCGCGGSVRRSAYSAPPMPRPPDSQQGGQQGASLQQGCCM